MPKSRRELTGGPRRARHDPLQRPEATVQRAAEQQVIPVLAKLPLGPGDGTVPGGEKVWALASVSTLLADGGDSADAKKDRRLLLSSNVVARVLYALETDTDLEVRREASGVLRNLCVEGHADVVGEIGNKGGVDVALQCLRWAAIGLQIHEHQRERAREPALAERERLLGKPAAELNRKERRLAAKLAAGKLPAGDAHADFAGDAHAHGLDVQGWADDAPTSLAAMQPNAAQCLVDMCENLVTMIGCFCELSDKLLLRVVRWDWRRDPLAPTSAEPVPSPYAGADVAAWLCQGVALGVGAAESAADAPLDTDVRAALVALGTACANTLCAMTDEDRYGVALGVVGLPHTMEPEKKGKARAPHAPLPTPPQLRVARELGQRRLAMVARGTALLSEPAAARAALLGTIACGVLCNVLNVLQSSDAPHGAPADPAAEVVVANATPEPLRQYVLDTVVARLLAMLARGADVDAGAAENDAALQTQELALEIIAETLSTLGKGDRAVEGASITELPIAEDMSEEWDEEMFDGDPVPEDTEDAGDVASQGAGDASPPSDTPAEGELGHWAFARVLQSEMLPILLRLAAPTPHAEATTAAGAGRRAVQLRALAGVNNFLLRLALFAPPPPSQWPSDARTLARISLWRRWVGTSYLDEGGEVHPSTVGTALHDAFQQLFVIASHWAAVPSVAQADSRTETEPLSAASAPRPGSVADDGLGIIDTCLGALWSIARILEGQLPLVDGHNSSPSPPVVALMAVFHAAQQASVQVKGVGALAVLARSKYYRVDPGAAQPPEAYARVYATLGDFLISAAAAVLARAPTPGNAEVLSAVLNAVIDTYANELAPWDRVYAEGGFQQRLAALLPGASALVCGRGGRADAQVKRLDRTANPALYRATKESVRNLREFLEYRASL
ncbi:hypothetical protein MSPP1_000679 [Malassezia sp. CBS 17886]|nr:hypothetical protein MSPP1_000679 [Malassezia sp. CBS 17886]